MPYDVIPIPSYNFYKRSPAELIRIDSYNFYNQKRK